MSILLALALTSVFSLNSFAAPELNASPEPAAPATYQSLGTLRGTAIINGSKVKTGAIVEATGETAVIDLGVLGRIEFRPGSKFTLMYADGMVDIKSHCGTTWFEVRRGQAELRRPSGEKETIVAVNDKKFDGEADIVTPGATDLVIDCGDKIAGGFWVGPGALGILALLGLGTAVAIGISIGDNDGNLPTTTPPATPVVP
jgi:hypothetical protein